CMSSRLVALSTGFIFIFIAVIFIIYLEGLWKYIIVGPSLLFGIASIKTGLFSSQHKLDKMTGVDKL
ncbi:hypothetical protein JYU13_00915, partial [Gammaproteobacteria bacterium AH-315-M22]|nr:hypothetical protein [Gammaproteobacteria bacterium AH-315-M22]